MKRIYTPTKRKNILIVDDDHAVASIYQKRLENEGYDVEVAGTGERALQMLETERVDLVVLDLSLPEMNGAEVLSAIRLQAGAEALPIIVFSNAYVPGLMQAASEAGATRCVRKSDCTPRQMAEIVREVLAASPAAAGSPAPGEVFSDVESASGPAADLPVGNRDEALSAPPTRELINRRHSKPWLVAPHILTKAFMIPSQPFVKMNPAILTELRKVHGT